LASGFDLEQQPCCPRSLPTQHTPKEHRPSQPATLNQQISYVSAMVLMESALVCTLMSFSPMTDEKKANAARDKDPDKLSQAGHKQTTHTLIQPKVALGQ